ncbi:MAG: hypothetical protein PW786_04425 [Arachidicoccus sp.]|nr:hypothetical protein [Arachidicoccus sp.]
MKKKIFIPFFISLFLIAEGMYGLMKGIEHHEVWRISLASVALAFWLFFTFVLTKRIFKKEQKTF